MDKSTNDKTTSKQKLRRVGLLLAALLLTIPLSFSPTIFMCTGRTFLLCCLLYLRHYYIVHCRFYLYLSAGVLRKDKCGISGNAAQGCSPAGTEPAHLPGRYGKTDGRCKKTSAADRSFAEKRDSWRRPATSAVIFLLLFRAYVISIIVITIFWMSSFMERKRNVTISASLFPVIFFSLRKSGFRLHLYQPLFQSA